MESAKISITRLKGRIEDLAKIGATEQGGVSRFALTQEDVKARKIVIEWMKQAGLDVYVDNVGNIHGSRLGSDRKLPPLMMGSHIDTQPNGGWFDGVLGSLGAIEVIMTLKENNLHTQHPLEVVIYTDEEGRFIPPMTGSKAIAGILSVEEAYRSIDKQEKTYLEALREAGIDPIRLESATRKKGSIESSLELHIEQAAHLHNDKIPVGIVESIVGISSLAVAIIGRQDHQAMKLDLRKDALLGAAEIVLAVNQIPRGISNTAVALVGSLNVFPGARAVVPGKVEFTIDMRDVTKDDLQRLEVTIVRKIEEVCERRDLQHTITKLSYLEPTLLSEKVLEAIERASRRLNLVTVRMHSGAGHDSQNIAKIADAGMIFVPSKDGRSHCPQEWTNWDDVERGCNLLMHSIFELDKRSSRSSTRR